MHKAFRIDHIAKYKKFVTDRDVALERIYRNYQVQISNELGSFLVWMIDVVRSRASRVVGRDNSVFFVNGVLKDLDKEYDKRKPQFVMAVTALIAKMSKETKALAFAAQAEALARSTGNIPRVRLQTHKDNPLVNNFGDSIPGRIELAIDRIKRKVWDKVQLSMVDGSDMQTLMDRILMVMPKKKAFKRPKRITRITEADIKDVGGNDVSVLTGTISDEMWASILDSYKKEYALDRRGPEYIVSGKQDDPDAVYEWEIEQQAGDEFYAKVMDGDKDAADQSGVDLVWIAVLDNRTGESDAWRDGRLLSEIKDTLDSDGEDPFGNELLMPPIHPFCRCRVAPVTNDIPEPRVVDNEDFEAWLNAQ